jgi:hypothetical protein
MKIRSNRCRAAHPYRNVPKSKNRVVASPPGMHHRHSHAISRREPTLTSEPGNCFDFAFFKPAEAGDGTISGEPYRTADTGAPILVNAQASVECRVAEIVERGDHHIVIGEVVAAHVASPPAGRPDAAILEMKDLGEKVFYGG